MLKKVRTLIISGYGINCEREMALAAERAGSSATIRHLHHLTLNPSILTGYQLLLIPGGFSFGDELGAGKVFSGRLLASGLKERLQAFVQEGNCILGVCNGFQILLKLGLLPGGEERSSGVSLHSNSSGRFENRWTQHRVLPSPCVFTRGLEQLYLPVRHAEGNCVFSSAEERKRLLKNGQIPLQYADDRGNASSVYPENPNGSEDAVAGICDPTGRVLGMMAHPEAFIHILQHPCWTRLTGSRESSGQGLRLFQNAIHYLTEKKHERQHFHPESPPLSMPEGAAAELCAGSAER